VSEQTVILFPTSAHVMRAEKLLKDEGFPCKLIPVPRALSSDCGICLAVPTSDFTEICELLTTKKVDYDDIALLD
jgi:hypothetical protein